MSKTTKKLVEAIDPNNKPTKAWYKRAGIKLLNLAKAIIDWVWNVPVPYLTLAAVVFLASLKVLEMLQKFASNNDNLKYLVGGIMAVILGLMVNRLHALLKK